MLPPKILWIAMIQMWPIFRRNCSTCLKVIDDPCTQIPFLIYNLMTENLGDVLIATFSSGLYLIGH